MSTWNININVVLDRTDLVKTAGLEFPHRPTEAELKLALCQFFSKLGFRLDENLDEVRDCMLLTAPPTRSKNANCTD